MKRNNCSKGAVLKRIIVFILLGAIISVLGVNYVHAEGENNLTFTSFEELSTNDQIRSSNISFDDVTDTNRKISKDSESFFGEAKEVSTHEPFSSGIYPVKPEIEAIPAEDEHKMISLVLDTKETKKTVKESPIPKVLKNTYDMPTVDDYKGTSEDTRDRIAGTDIWNDMIYEISMDEGVDPVLVKVIMAYESRGDMYAVNSKNKNKTTDYGLMMVNDSWGDEYDYDKILEDPEYAIRSGINVLKFKSDYCKQFGKKATIFNVCWFYNGYSKQGKAYAKNVSKIYKDLTGLDTTNLMFEINN